MRGNDALAGYLFSYVHLEKRVHPDHPLRVIRGLVNSALADLSTAFDALYSPFGRESIQPERLLRALLLQAFYSIRSELTCSPECIHSDGESSALMADS